MSLSLSLSLSEIESVSVSECESQSHSESESNPFQIHQIYGCGVNQQQLVSLLQFSQWRVQLLVFAHSQHILVTVPKFTKLALELVSD